MKMSETQDAYNRRALMRLERAVPDIFPKAVLTYALNRRWTPPMPRLAVDGYWRSHIVRADRLARTLATRSGTPDGWTWRIGSKGLPASFRAAPAPYREKKHALGPGFCCVCGQPVYRFGWHADLWDAGPNRNAVWHSACVAAWRLWHAPSDHIRMLKLIQGRRCAETGGRIWKTAEVDHREPLFRVWGERRDLPWPSLLTYWGVPNLRVINRDAHAAKCAEEATYRGKARKPAADEPAPPLRRQHAERV